MRDHAHEMHQKPNQKIKHPAAPPRRKQNHGDEPKPRRELFKAQASGWPGQTLWKADLVVLHLWIKLSPGAHPGKHYFRWTDEAAHSHKHYSPSHCGWPPYCTFPAPKGEQSIDRGLPRGIHPCCSDYLTVIHENQHRV